MFYRAAYLLIHVFLSVAVVVVEVMYTRLSCRWGCCTFDEGWRSGYLLNTRILKYLTQQLCMIEQTYEMRPGNIMLIKVSVAIFSINLFLYYLK